MPKCSLLKKVFRLFTQHTLSALILLTAACGSVSSGENRATLDAQLERASNLATRIAKDREITQQAFSIQATATRQVLQQIFENARQWPLLVESTFDTDQGVWITGEQSNEYGTSQWRIEGGKYQWEVLGIQRLVWWSIPDMQPVSDFHLSVSATQLEGSSATLIGLVFRKQESEAYYVFQVDPLQHYAVYLNIAGEWHELIPWSDSTAIIPNGDNQLEVIGQDNRFHFFINSQYVDEIIDDSWSEGTAGILVGLNDPDDKGVWAFDDFLVRLPPDTNTPPGATP